MRVLVTGGTGAVGRAVTERLVGHGWDVRVIGIEPTCALRGAQYTCCDTMNYADLRDQIRGCQVVVHLAAIPNPRDAPGHELFRVNAAGTFSVFEAAASEGVKRVVQASSINALGCAWGIVDVEARYFPIDEAHPTATTDVYSFSKQTVEEIGAYYWRRERISSLALRLPAVLPAGRGGDKPYRQSRERMRAALDALAVQSDEQRAARLADARQRALAFRAQRMMEYPKAGGAATTDDLIWKAYTFDRFNFWAYIDERDSAQAVEKGLTAEFEGSPALFVNADRNSLNYDSQTLVRLFFPDVCDWKRPLEGAESLVSIDQARALIGFAPEHLMQD